MLTDTNVDVRFNVLFFKRIWRLLTFMLPTVLSRYRDWLLVILVTVLAVGEQVVIYFVGLVPSKYYAIIPLLNWHKFWMLVLYSLFLVCVEAIVLSLEMFLARILYIVWRRNLCRTLNTLYFRNMNFYTLNTELLHIDNLDQRLTQDIDLLTTTSSGVLKKIIILPLTAIYYSYEIFANIRYYGFLGPVVFFAVFTIGNKFLISYVSPYIYEQERLEGIYRYNHVRIRRDCDSLAMSKGSEFEEKITDRWLGRLVSILYSRTIRELALQLWENFAAYFGSILSYLIVGLAVIKGNFPDENVSVVISQYSFKIMYLIFVFSSLIQMNTDVSVIVGAATRISVVIEATEGKNKKDFKPHSKIPGNDNKILSFKNFTCGLPNRLKIFLNDLNFEIKRGDFGVITGPSGCGKTSFFRTIMNVWNPLRGTMSMAKDITLDDVMCLPQIPYCTLGSLREQITFPKMDDYDNMRLIEDLLIEFDLLHLKDRVDSNVPENLNWYETLSPGERQRLSFVRLFYHRPTVVLLDESFSYTGEDVQRKVYGKCRDLKMTVLSISHIPSALEFQDWKICFTGNGDWVVLRKDQFNQEISHF